MKHTRKTGGFTLIEALVAMSVATLIMGVVSSIGLASMQVWRRCSSQSQADPPAHLTIGRISKELKNAYRVDSMGSNSIIFTIPRRDSSGTNIMPLTPGTQISYYLSDSTGQSDKPGTVLWRREENMQTQATTYRRIAGNVAQLGFSYDATASRVLKIYAISITIVGQEGRERYHSVFGAHVAFRNGA